jgi:hypothetical protein
LLFPTGSATGTTELNNTRLRFAGAAGYDTRIERTNTNELTYQGYSIFLDGVQIEPTKLLVFRDTDDTHETTFAAGDQVADINYTLPAVAPAAGSLMNSDAAGVLSWITTITSAQHGTIAAGDLHSVYLKEEASGGLASEVPDHTHASGAEAGTVSHAVLTGVTADQHHNQLHAAAHAENAADELLVELLGTTETDTSLRLAPDGTGGLEWGTGGSGSGHTIQDEGVAIAAQTIMDFKGAYLSAQNDAAATASKIRAGYSHYDGIVDSSEWEALVTDTADSVSGGTTDITVTAAGWVANEWAKCRVLIYNAAGTTLRAVKTITSNTTDTISWSGAVAGLVAGDSFIIQPSPPVYRRLAEAIAAGHVSILYRQTSGELATVTIDSSMSVAYIIGDSNQSASISSVVSVSKNSVIFDQVQFLSTTTFSGTGVTAIGCIFGAGSVLTLSGTGAGVIACSFVGSSAVSVTGANNRISACLFSLMSSQLVVASGSARRTAVIGCVNTSNAETGYLIDLSTSSNDGTINGNVLTVPTTATGAARITATSSNVSGNYIELPTTSASTYVGVNVFSRGVASGNVIRTGSLSSTGTIYGVLMSGSGSVASSNVLVASGATGTSTLVGARIVTGGRGNVILGNVFMLVTQLSGTPAVIGIDAGDTVATDFVAVGNVHLGPASTTFPSPWRPYSRISDSSTVLGIDGGFDETMPFKLARVEEFADGVLPAGWTSGGTAAPTFPSGVQGGVARMVTGAVSGNDSFLAHTIDHASIGVTYSPVRVAGTFSLNTVTNVQAWIGLATAGVWAAGMARPSTGLVLELDTNVDAFWHLLYMDGGTVRADRTIPSMGLLELSAEGARQTQRMTNQDDAPVGRLYPYPIGTNTAIFGLVSTETAGDAGTTTSTTSTVLTDTGQAWTVSELVGMQLRYTSGPAAGQALVITANTATTITTTAFSPAPTVGGGDTYVVEPILSWTLTRSKPWAAITTRMGASTPGTPPTLNGTAVTRSAHGVGTAITFTAFNCSAAVATSCLVVSVIQAIGTTGPTSVTFDGEAMTSVGSVTLASNARAEIFRRTTTDGLNAVSGSIVVNYASSTPILLNAMLWDGVDQTTPFASVVTATGTNAAPSVTGTGSGGDDRDEIQIGVVAVAGAPASAGNHTFSLLLERGGRVSGYFDGAHILQATTGITTTSTLVTPGAYIQTNAAASVTMDLNKLIWECGQVTT